MAQVQRIRAFDYVNHPYERVRAVLHAQAPGVFKAATTAATARAASLVSELHVDIGGIKLAADVAIVVRTILDHPGDGRSGPKTVLHLEWEAANRPFLFPFMKGELAIYPLTQTETQLDFSGGYVVPFGVLGAAFDAVVGHRIAESTVHSFVTEVATYLRTTLRA